MTSQRPGRILERHVYAEVYAETDVTFPISHGDDGLTAFFALNLTLNKDHVFPSCLFPRQYLMSCPSFKLFKAQSLPPA